jgi:hypothetical protein
MRPKKKAHPYPLRLLLETPEGWAVVVTMEVSFLIIVSFLFSNFEGSTWKSVAGFFFFYYDFHHSMEGSGVNLGMA